MQREQSKEPRHVLESNTEDTDHPKGRYRSPAAPAGVSWLAGGVMQGGAASDHVVPLEPVEAVLERVVMAGFELAVGLDKCHLNSTSKGILFAAVGNKKNNVA